MNIALESFTTGNPSPNSTLRLKRTSMSLCSSPASLRVESLFRPHNCRVPTVALSVSPRGLGFGLLPLHRPSFRNRSIFSFAASHEPSEIEVQEEKNDLKVGNEESDEAWKQALASFKEQALKMRSISQEAYEVYSKKAFVILKETSEQLKIQAEKASDDLTVIVKAISEEGKEYLAADDSPELLKDIVETFASSTDELKEISQVRDFYLGIPYGGLLFLRGFLSFMLTGSISDIRFRVIPGGALLALSITSLRLWKRGESSPLVIKGQAAIATMLFLRKILLLFVRPEFISFLAVLFSGAAVAFYVYRISLFGGQTKESNFKPGTEN